MVSGGGKGPKREDGSSKFREIVVQAMLLSFCITKTRDTLDFFVYAEIKREERHIYIYNWFRFGVSGEGQGQKIYSSMQVTSGAHIN